MSGTRTVSGFQPGEFKIGRIAPNQTPYLSSRKKTALIILLLLGKSFFGLESREHFSRQTRCEELDIYLRYQIRCLRYRPNRRGQGRETLDPSKKRHCPALPSASSKFCFTHVIL
jgi:hypothetical protein